MTSLQDDIAAARIVPVVAIHDAAHAVPLCAALKAGGLNVIEITFRTDAAAQAMQNIATQMPDFILGAGTVTLPEEVTASKEAGAKFAVAPGFNPDIVEKAQSLGLPFFPGICTPSDIEAALALGCQTLKFFPAGAMGGIKTLKAIGAPYKHRGVRFVPTGGISAANLTEYLESPLVLAIGGSWIVASDLIQAENWGEIMRLTAEAVAAAKSVS